MLSSAMGMMRVSPWGAGSLSMGSAGPAGRVGASPSAGAVIPGVPVAYAGVEAKGVSHGANAAIGAAMVLAEMLTGGLFLENLKMEKQRTSNPYPVIVRQLLRGSFVDKVIGFEAGFLPWGVVLGIAKGAVLLGAKSFFNKTYGGMEMLSSDQAELLAGVSAGATQGLFISPLLLARTRVNKALVSRPPMSPMQEIGFSFKIMNGDIKSKGLFRGAILPGLGACIAKRSLDWGSRFAIILYLKKALAHEDGSKFSNTEVFGISFLGGVLSVSVTMPVDRILPVIQGATSSGEGVLQVMRARFAAEGMATWFRGWFVRAIHTGWHSGFALGIGAAVVALIADDDDDDE